MQARYQEDKSRPRFETVTAARVFCVCRVRCAKAVGATSNEDFLVFCVVLQPVTQNRSSNCHVSDRYYNDVGGWPLGPLSFLKSFDC